MLRTIFVFAILVPWAVLAFTSRLRALTLYLWFAFFRPQEWMWFQIQEYRLSMLLWLILVLPAIFTGVFPNMTHPMSIGVITFMLSGLLAQSNAIDQTLGWRWIGDHGSLTVMCLLAISIIRTPRDLMRALAVPTVCLGFYGAKAGFMSLISGGVQYGDGLSGGFMDNNAWAVGTVMTIPFLIALAQNADVTFDRLVPVWAIRWIRIGLYASVPLSGYTIVSTFSRGGFLALVAAIFTYALFHPRRIRLVVTFALLGALLYVVPLPQGYFDRIATISQLQEDVPPEQVHKDVTEGRFYFWGVALTMVQDYPLGVGMRNFSAQYNLYDTLGGVLGGYRDVHSSHFQVLAEHGFLGAAAWVLLFGYSFVTALRVRKRARTPGLSNSDARLMATLSLAFVVSMVAFIVGGATVSMALNDLTWVTFALLASLGIVSARLCAEAAAKGRVAVQPAGHERQLRPAVSDASGSVAHVQEWRSR